MSGNQERLHFIANREKRCELCDNWNINNFNMRRDYAMCSAFRHNTGNYWGNKCDYFVRRNNEE